MVAQSLRYLLLAVTYLLCDPPDMHSFVVLGSCSSRWNSQSWQKHHWWVKFHRGAIASYQTTWGIILQLYATNVYSLTVSCSSAARLHDDSFQKCTHHSCATLIIAVEPALILLITELFLYALESSISRKYKSQWKSYNWSEKTRGWDCHGRHCPFSRRSTEQGSSSTTVGWQGFFSASSFTLVIFCYVGIHCFWVRWHSRLCVHGLQILEGCSSLWSTDLKNKLGFWNMHAHVGLINMSIFKLDTNLHVLFLLIILYYPILRLLLVVKLFLYPPPPALVWDVCM